MTCGVLSLSTPRAPDDPAAAVACAEALAAAIAAHLPVLPRPEEALAATLPFLAVRGLHEPCFVLDEAHHILYANPPAEAALGAPRASVEGRPLHTVLRTETAVPEAGYFGSLEHHDGAARLVAYFACPVVLSGGRQSTLLLFHVLLADESQREEQLRSAEYTGIVQTIATVNHTINSPLFGLLITAQMLEGETNASPAVSKKVRRIIECAERIREVTELLSRVIRPARGTYAADEQMLDLSGATAISSAPPALQQDGARVAPRMDDQGGNA